MGKDFKNKTVVRENKAAKPIARVLRWVLRKLFAIMVYLGGIILIFLLGAVLFYGLRWMGVEAGIAFDAVVIAAVGSLLGGVAKPVEKEDCEMEVFAGFVFGGVFVVTLAVIPTLANGGSIGRMGMVLLFWFASTLVMMPGVWLINRGDWLLDNL